MDARANLDVRGRLEIVGGLLFREGLEPPLAGLVDIVDDPGLLLSPLEVVQARSPSAHDEIHREAERLSFRLRAIDRFPQRVQRKAVYAGGRCKSFDARIDRTARIVTEDAGKLEGVAADEALDAVEIHPGLRTQQISLASGKSSTSAGSFVVQPRLVSKITVSGVAEW